MGSYEDSSSVNFQVSGLDGSVKAVGQHTLTGTYYGLGLIYSPFPFVGLLMEYALNNQKIKFKESKTTLSITGQPDDVSETKASDMDPSDLETKVNGATVRFGINISI